MNPVFNITRGDDEAFELTFTDNTVTPAVPLNITGYTIRLIIWERGDTGTELIRKNMTSHVDPAAGKTILTLTNTETMKPEGSYTCHIKSIDPAAVVKTIIKGTAVFD